MKLGIMQPYFFPYAGHFELIAKTSDWVVFDVVKYNRRSWMNRNRIQHPTSGWQYINVPVQHAEFDAPIEQIRVVDKDGASAKLLRQLAHYERRAPNYRNVLSLVRDGFDRCASDRLVDLNVSTLAAVCDYLQIPFRWRFASSLNLAFDCVEHAGQWALCIAKALNATEYMNPQGGAELFRQEEWDEAGIALSFLPMRNFAYKCAPYDFVPNLSILDALMWLSPEQIREAWQIER